jgi:hypothetical protein
VSSISPEAGYWLLILSKRVQFPWEKQDASDGSSVGCGNVVDGINLFAKKFTAIAITSSSVGLTV